MTGKLISEPFKESVKNGDAEALFAEVKLSTGDVRTVQLFPGINAELWPRKGDVVVVNRAGGFLYATAIWDGKEPALEPGETEIYSRNDDREKVASTHMDNKGNVTSKFKGSAVITINGDDRKQVDKNTRRLIVGNLEIIVRGKITIESNEDVAITGRLIRLN